MTVEITFRTLKGLTFKLPAEPSDTILDVKRKVANEQSVADHAAYRLIYKGKLLADDATINSAGISAAGFVVVMPPTKLLSKTAQKPPTPPVKPPVAADPPRTKKKSGTVAAPSVPSPPSAIATDPTNTDSTPITTPTATATANATPPAPADASAALAASTAGSRNSLVTGPAYDQSVRQMCEMGFPEEQVKQALRAAFNNPDRAVDFLLNGVPDTSPAVPASAVPTTGSTPAPGSAPAPSTTPSAAPPPSASNSTSVPSTAPSAHIPFNMFEAPPPGQGASEVPAQSSGNLDFLRSYPQFNMMRHLIQSSPTMLPHILQQLESMNPSLMSIIDRNQAEFSRLIREPLREGEEAGDEDMGQLPQTMGDGDRQIFVTEEEHQQINRLTELASSIGLEQSHVVQTWLICSRNETLAANYLVDHAEELKADLSLMEMPDDADNANTDRPNQPDQPDSGNQGPPA